MIRRDVLSLLAALALTACASAPQPAAPTVSAGGFASDRVIITTRGQGPDVILIPGLTSSTEIWDTTAAALESRHRVHLVQLNGFAGFDAAGNAEGPVSAPVAEEIARYIRETGLQRPAVIGHSMGGTIGMMLTARHPDAVGKLMVVDMVPFMGVMFGGADATPESVRPVALQIRTAMIQAPQGIVSAQTRQIIDSMVRTESARPRIVGHARESDNRVSANAYYELVTTDLRPELARITQPFTVLYVIPPNTPITPAQYDAYVRASYANAPNARLVKIEESYHFIMIDQFDRFMQEVNEFLGG
jgi:pimeloyl-ACP methyl ester carboxylesterase